ncbi:hypothetical protein AB0L14_30510 [Streptomyces sp. NPDC052727]|uniref:GNAT family N-acetyltransferase n=1 Tax=Streptomyces sp. NPDC052727 TaxID=3154854 RepID=UPI003435E054
MRPDDWRLTEDVDAFLARAGDFLRSRPALHTTPLSVTEKLRTLGAAAHGGRFPVFGLLERADEQLLRWCREFAADVGEDVTIDAASWAGTRFAEKRYTFSETPNGTPVSMAGANPMVGGQVRVDPVYTPAHVRGRGYAGAVTVEVSRAAPAAGAQEVVLYTNAADPGDAVRVRSARSGWRRKRRGRGCAAGAV